MFPRAGFITGLVLVAAVTAMAPALGASDALAAVPDSINFQGILRNSGGSPVPNATYSVTFAIYDAAVGGSQLWSETQSVSTDSGQFTVLLGSVTPFPETILSGPNRFVEIQVSPDPPMAQRIPLTSAGFASVTSRVSGDITTFADADSSVVRIKSPDSDSGYIEIISRSSGQGDTLSSQWLGFISEDGDTTISFFNATLNAGPKSFLASNLDRSKSNVNRKKEESSKERTQITILGDTDTDSIYSLKVLPTGGPGGGPLFATTVSSAKSNQQERHVGNTGSIEKHIVDAGGNTVYSRIYDATGGPGGGPLFATTTSSPKSDAKVQERVDSSGVELVMTDAAGDTVVQIKTGDGGAVLMPGTTIRSTKSNTSERLKILDQSGNEVVAVTGEMLRAKEVRSDKARIGLNNCAGGTQAFVAGENNCALGSWSTVTGGKLDTAGGGQSVVSGGEHNKASGNWSTIPGGKDNVAAGQYSFAAGRKAQANHEGAFVWGASSDSGTVSSGPNQVIMRASAIWLGDMNTFNQTIPGGDYLYTTTGAHLTTGGAWTNASDANKKENFSPVDSDELLAKVAELPITQWNYKSEDDQVRHIGPSAQDFHALFGVGTDDKSISTIDPAGIALAAIQALNEKLNEQAAENEQLKKQIRELREMIRAQATNRK